MRVGLSRKSLNWSAQSPIIRRSKTRTVVTFFHILCTLKFEISVFARLLCIDEPFRCRFGIAVLCRASVTAIMWPGIHCCNSLTAGEIDRFLSRWEIYGHLQQSRTQQSTRHAGTLLDFSSCPPPNWLFYWLLSGVGMRVARAVCLFVAEEGVMEVLQTRPLERRKLCLKCMPWRLWQRLCRSSRPRQNCVIWNV